MHIYQPKSSLVSPRFCDPASFMRLPYVPDPPPEVDFAVIGIPFDDATTFRSGARFGPGAVREMSRMLRAYNPELEVAVFPTLKGVDAGDVAVVPGYLDDTYRRITARLEPLHRQGTMPIGLGGDHSVTLGELRAAAAVHGPLALVHFDAHNDTLDEYYGHKYNHGTPFRRACEEKLIDPLHSIQVGMRGSVHTPKDRDEARALGFTVVPATEALRQGPGIVVERIHKVVNGRPVFLTFDIDAVDPAYAPGTGTPEAGGFSGPEALALVRGCRGLDLRGADLVEVSPPYDPAEITALLAANLVFEMISLVALAKIGNQKCTARAQNA